jgi:hypothetical protein
MSGCLASLALLLLAATAAPPADPPPALNRCEVVPLPHHQVSLRIDGIEKTRWHFAGDAPRPFFYPFRGPSGATLTRMGHPGAANHDHHRSIWLAHNDVSGVDFWSDQTEGRIRQESWYAYQDGEDEAVMAVATHWYDGQGRQLMQQDVIAALMPLARGEHTLELQITMRPPAGAESVQLGKTNFGLLAVRVAKTVSVYFGGGQLTSSNRQQGAAALFGKTARWMDYSGPVAVGRGPKRKATIEGITFFDHPDNPRYPTPWHVREDGWMGASLCMHEGFTIPADAPLTLRYLLHAHAGAYDHAKAETVHTAFARRTGFHITKATTKHRQYDVIRNARHAQTH